MCKDLNPIGERSSHLTRYGFTSATEATTELNRLNPTSKLVPPPRFELGTY